MPLRHREKVFGPGRAIPLDRNAKARIAAYARAWSARHRQDRQHKGPLTRAFLEVLEALLWRFHNSRSGCCFPSYERIAERAGCCRRTVAEAIKALEFAGVLSWQHRITRVREACQDLWGRQGWRWRVVRTSNAYVFQDPLRPPDGVAASKCKNPPGTLGQEDSKPLPAAAPDPDSALERALTRFGAALAAERGIEQAGGGPGPA